MFKNFILLLMIVTSTAYADEINVLRSTPPGGSEGLYADSVVEILNKNQLQANLVGFNNCKEAANWIEKNPRKPWIMMTHSDPLLLNLADPHDPASCNVPLTKDTLITVVGKTNYSICSRKDSGLGLEQLLSMPNPRIGIFNTKILRTTLTRQLNEIGVKNARVVAFSSGKDNFRAFAAGDTDFIVIGAQNIIDQVGAQCFLTTALPGNAPQGRVSMSTLNPKVSYANSGITTVAVGNHIDRATIRELFVDAYADRNSMLYKSTSTLTPHGIFAKESLTTQLNTIDTIVRDIRKEK